MSDNTCSKLHFFARHTGAGRYPVVESSLINWMAGYFAVAPWSGLGSINSPRVTGMTASLPSTNSEQKLNNTWKTPILLKFILISTLLLPITQPCAQNLIAVMDLTSKGNVSNNLMDSLCNKISQEITSDTRYTAFDRQFIPFTLEQSTTKLSLPCADTKCLTQAGTLLGAKYIIGGSLQLSKNKLEIDLNRVDVETGKSIQTAQGTFTGATNDFINANLRSIVQNLMNDNKPAPAPTPIANKTSSNNLLARIAISALTVAGGGAAVYFYNKKGQTAANGDLPMDDVPGHDP
jgi:hypothetical protein